MFEKDAFIFVNGVANDGVMVQHALNTSPDAQVIAVDGGTYIAQHFGRTPDVVIGDLDSVTDETLAQLRAQGVQIEKYPTRKDMTDLELALQYAIEHDLRWIRFIGALGGRYDQTLANTFLMASPELKERNIALVAGDQFVQLWHPGRNVVYGQTGDTVSLIPVGGDVTAVRTEHLDYPLRSETLHFGSSRGISNRLTARRAEVWFDSGILLMVHIGSPASDFGTTTGSLHDDSAQNDSASRPDAGDS